MVSGWANNKNETHAPVLQVLPTRCRYRTLGTYEENFVPYIILLSLYKRLTSNLPKNPPLSSRGRYRKARAHTAGKPQKSHKSPQSYSNSSCTSTLLQNTLRKHKTRSATIPTGYLLITFLSTHGGVQYT